MVQGARALALVAALPRPSRGVARPHRLVVPRHQVCWPMALNQLAPKAAWLVLFYPTECWYYVLNQLCKAFFYAFEPAVRMIYRYANACVFS